MSRSAPQPRRGYGGPVNEDDVSAVTERTRRPAVGKWTIVVGVVVAGAWALALLRTRLPWPVVADQEVLLVSVGRVPTSMLWFLVVMTGAAVVALVIDLRGTRSDAGPRRLLRFLAAGLSFVVVLAVVLNTAGAYQQSRSGCIEDSDSSSCHFGENWGRVTVIAPEGSMVTVRTEEGTSAETWTGIEDRYVWTRGSWIDVTATAVQDSSGTRVLISCNLIWNGSVVADEDGPSDSTVTCEYHAS